MLIHGRAAIGHDYETHPIMPLPAPPPEPVGMSVHWPGQRPRYMAWGHLGGGNNCTRTEAEKEVRRIHRSGRQVIGHNYLNFDNAVTEQHFDLPQLPYDRVIDTMACAFLCDPNAKNHGLKPLLESWCGEVMSARDELREWIFKHVPGSTKAKTKWGQHIAKTPGDLAGRYAIEDATGPKRLLAHMREHLDLDSMLGALDMEQWWLQHATRMERRGVPIAEARLRRDVEKGFKGAPGWDAAIEASEQWIRKRLRAPNINLNANQQVADRMEELGCISVWADDDGKPTDEFAWFLTKKGYRSTRHEDLRVVCLDEDLVSAIRYRNLMRTYRTTFAGEWLRQCDATGDSTCQFGWNTIRRPAKNGVLDTEDQIGARTGRMSSNPNAQNMPKRPRGIAFNRREVRALEARGAEAIKLPRALLAKVCALPNLRSYIAAPQGMAVNTRDFTGQELRIAAHYAGGMSADLFRRDPFLDFHKWVTDYVNAELGTTYVKATIKNVVFAILYAAGLLKLASQIGRTPEDAQVIRNVVRTALADMVAHDRAMKGLEAADEAFWTLGGRRYRTEERTWEQYENGDYSARSWAYKNFNTQIQGSAGDQTKRAGRNIVEINPEFDPLIIVHDEYVDMCEAGDVGREQAVWQEAMEDGTQHMIDVPVVSAGKWSRRSWGQLQGWRDAA